MILAKIIAFTILAGSAFAVSTVSTITISQNFNKTPISDNVNSEEDSVDEEEEIIKPRELTHSEQFIINLTGFGNLQANLDLNLSYKEETLNINGEAFVSMETTENIEVYADLDVKGFGKETNVVATYKEETVYVNIDERKLLLHTADINEIITLFKDLLPTEGENSLLPEIDTDKLLANLGAMTYEEQEKEIVYTCNLLDDFPPIIFRSDYDHNLTGVSLTDAKLGDLSISLNATAKVLGKGRNLITLPEDVDSYINVKNYFGIADQIKGFIDNPQFDISYKLKAYEKQNELVTTSGELYLDLKDKRDFVVDGNLNFQNLNVDYKLGYVNKNAFVNINDSFKAYLEETGLSKAKEDIATLINNELFSSFTASFDNISLPVLDLIKAEDYKALLSKYNYINIDNEGLTLSLNNSLLSSNQSDVTITLKILEEGLKNITISNLAYNDYHFDLELDVNEFKELPVINFDEYFKADKYINIISQVDNILKDKAGNVGFIIDVKEKESDFLSLRGDVNISLKEDYQINASAHLKYKDELDNLIHVDVNKDRIAFDIDTEHKFYLKNDGLYDFIDTVLGLFDGQDALNIMGGLDKLSMPLMTIISTNDYLSLVDYFSDIKFSDNSISMNVSNSLFGNNEGAFNIGIKLNDNGISQIIVKDFTYGDYQINVSLSINNYDDTVEVTDIKDYVDLATYLPVVEQIQNIITNKEVGCNYEINLLKNNESALKVNGEIDLDFENALSLFINGELKKGDNKASFLVNIGDEIALNYNDVLKLLISNEDATKTIENVLSLMNNDILKDISNQNIKEYLNKIDSLKVSDQGLVITLINDNELKDIASISIKLTKEGLNDITVSNLALGDYVLEAKLSLKDYKEQTLDKTGYASIKHLPTIINQINDYLNKKEGNVGINLNIGDININGEVEVKYDEYLSLYLNTLIKDNNNNSYHVEFEKDNENYYLIFDGHNFNIKEESVNEIIEDIKGLIEDKESVLYQNIGLLNDIPAISIEDLIFDLPIKSISNNGDKLDIVIDLNMFDIDSSLKIELAFNDEENIKEINIDTSINDMAINGSLSLNDYQDKHVNKTEDYTSLDTVITVTDYYTSLPASSQQAIIDQIKSYTDVNNLSLGVDYDIRVTRGNNLTFTTQGDIDFINNDKETSVYLIGDLVNKENEEILDSKFFVAYQDETVFFNYNDKLKLSYEKTAIEDLIEIVKTRLPLDISLEDLLNTLLPDGSTMSSPLFEIIGNGDYLSLTSYFKGFSKNGNYLVITLDASILGDVKGDLVISIDASNKIKEVDIKNVYAFGYNLDINLKLREFKSHTIDKEGYTSLNYINNIIDTIADLIDDNKYALTLKGDVTTKDGVIKFNGSTQFEIGDAYDRGIGKITITDKSNKDHNVVIDVKRNKTDDNASDEAKRTALNNSDVLFTYNDNLKGSFNLGSLSDTISLITKLATDGNKRVEKYKELLTADFSHSVLTEILNGNIEAILYQNLLEGIYYHDGNYEIELSGAFLKENTNVDVSNIFITLKMDENHKFKGLGIKGKVLDFDLNIALDLASYSENYKGLKKDNTYFDFSDMSVLVDYLLNTAGKDDFNLKGNLNVDLIIKEINVDLEGYVHILTDEDGNEKVFAKASIPNVPHFSVVSEHALIGWDKRSFDIYFTDDEVYLDLVCYYNGIFTSYNDSKHVRLTLEQFTDDILYYLVNFGLGIKEDVFDGRNYTSDSDHEIELSKLLKSYSYNEATPSWNLAIDMDELTGISVFSPLDVTITGDSNKLMKDITASSEIISIIDLDFHAEVKDYNYDQNKYNNISTYVSKHQNDTLGKVYEGDNK